MQSVILCDIDGTLAHHSERSPYDWKRVGEDTVDDVVADILEKYPHVVLISGRDGSCEAETVQWLGENNINYDLLIMRTPGDNRKDSIVKRELYDKFIKGTYQVLFVLDDRQQVVDMWRNELGLKCLQVAEGNF